VVFCAERGRGKGSVNEWFLVTVSVDFDFDSFLSRGVLSLPSLSWMMGLGGAVKGEPLMISQDLWRFIGYSVEVCSASIGSSSSIISSPDGAAGYPSITFGINSPEFVIETVGVTAPELTELSVGGTSARSRGSSGDE